MAYVTEDKDVKTILRLLKAKQLTQQEAAKQIKALGFLEWEVNEALGIKT